MKRAQTETELSGKTKPEVEPFRFFSGGGVTGGFGFLLVSRSFRRSLFPGMQRSGMQGNVLRG